MSLRVLIRGGGDIGSGVALRLVRSGFNVVVTEIEQPRVVRRAASYANAVYAGMCKVEETRGRLCTTGEVEKVFADHEVPILIDPQASCRNQLYPHVIVDARMAKNEPDLSKEDAPLVIGLGPGFVASVHCHAIVETKRGPTLGRVYWTGTSEADTGTPEEVLGYKEQRVLRASNSGIFKGKVEIGDLVKAGQALAEINGKLVRAEFDGVVRGLIGDGYPVETGMKIGDLDPRMDPRLCYTVSDKALAVGGGVLEAILSREDLRRTICSED